MGMFDTVNAKCVCGKIIEIQSKAGQCKLGNYSIKLVPAEIAAGINGRVIYCECGKEFKIRSVEPIRRVEMYLEEIP